MSEASYFPVIRSEDDAWMLLERVLREGLPDDAPPFVQFRSWPTIDIYLPETPIDGSITTSMMEAFLAYQEAINRTHALLATGSADLRGLTNDDRASLEVRVRVKAGSNHYIAEAGPIFERIAFDVLP